MEVPGRTTLGAAVAAANPPPESQHLGFAFSFLCNVMAIAAAMISGGAEILVIGRSKPKSRSLTLFFGFGCPICSIELFVSIGLSEKEINELEQHIKNLIMVYCLTLNIPDYDASAQVLKPIEMNTSQVDTVITMTKGTLFPMRGMNLGFDRELIRQAMYLSGVIGQPVGCYDGMWAC